MVNKEKKSQENNFKLSYRVKKALIFKLFSRF